MPTHSYKTQWRRAEHASSGDSRGGAGRMVVHAPDRLGVVARERVHVDTPVVNSLPEPSADRIATSTCRDRRLGPEHRLAGVPLLPAAVRPRGRHAPVHVLVPAGDAERNEGVEVAI